MRHKTISEEPKGRRGRSESCQTGSVHRLVPAGTKSRVRRRAQHGRGGSVSRRDHNQAYRRRAHLSGGTTYAEATTPNASRSSGGSAREGKDSHSRQWRLSMAVFLNRNKRPLAAPIEVAELLSEKPPPSHTPHVHPPLRKGARGRGFSLEKPPPPEFPLLR